MEIVLGMVLVVSIMILCALMFNGYILYRNSKNSSYMDSQKDERESHIVDLYNLLEHTMTEFDKYIDDVRAEIQRDRDEISKLKDDILIKLGSTLSEDEENKQDNEKVEETLETNLPPADIDIYKSKDLKEIKIKTLFNQGKSIPAIAKELGIGQGEVSLILDFDKNNKKNEKQ